MYQQVSCSDYFLLARNERLCFNEKLSKHQISRGPCALLLVYVYLQNHSLGSLFSFATKTYYHSPVTLLLQLRLSATLMTWLFCSLRLPPVGLFVSGSQIISPSSTGSTSEKVSSSNQFCSRKNTSFRMNYSRSVCMLYVWLVGYNIMYVVQCLSLHHAYTARVMFKKTILFLLHAYFRITVASSLVMWYVTSNEAITPTVLSLYQLEGGYSLLSYKAPFTCVA